MIEPGLTERELQMLAALFDTPERADSLLRDAGFPVARIPTMQGYAVAEYWRAVARLVDNGVMPDGRLNILTAASRQFPANETFAASSGGVQTPGPLSQPQPTNSPDRSTGSSSTGRYPPSVGGGGLPPRPSFGWPVIAASIVVAVLVIVGATLGVAGLIGGGSDDTPPGPAQSASGDLPDSQAPVPEPPSSGPGVLPSPKPVTSTPSGSGTPASCEPPAMDASTVTAAPVVEPGSVQGLTVASASYRLQVEFDNANITLAVDISGTIPAGKHLIIVARGLPNTQDKSGAKGADVDFYRDNYPLPGTGCHTFQKARLGYAGAAGLTYRFRVLLVGPEIDQYIATRRADPSYATRGMTKTALTQRGAQVVGGFDIVSAR
ncbi:hypothetical protein Ga0074812_1666 [Parafrankia irregularis]|uniref:Effector-associated domain-containing protein n=1 Tax=Parafrankia irregularis TaxID=795642 RepID=A0A0S4R0H2_9ACTN|nr:MULTISPECIES: effector-associated domain EAD1-containing protein [Parafrankia]MBE3202298.1 hypothetical protein [Parafrankia sp. CH37]CUU61235.1 hypothetical protein Ga0074812_1666 [Parafrankia irregularis]